MEQIQKQVFFLSITLFFILFFSRCVTTPIALAEEIIENTETAQEQNEDIEKKTKEDISDLEKTQKDLEDNAADFEIIEEAVEETQKSLIVLNETAKTFSDIIYELEKINDIPGLGKLIDQLWDIELDFQLQTSQIESLNSLILEKNKETQERNNIIEERNENLILRNEEVLKTNREQTETIKQIEQQAKKTKVADQIKTILLIVIPIIFTFIIILKK